MKIFKNLPVISIIIPLYNVAEYIEQCLQSVANQTYKGAIECIIVDDCGTDNSVQIVEDFIAHYQGSIQFRLLHHDYNRGLSAARNIGLDNANGDYIYFLDSDDWIDSNAIQNLYDAISSGDYVIAVSYFTANINGGADSVYREDWLFDTTRIIEPSQYAERFILEKSNHAATAKLYKKLFFNNLRFQEGKCNEDSLFIIDSLPIIKNNQFRCIEMPQYTYHYRIREDSICRGQNSSFKFDCMQNLKLAIFYYKDDAEIVALLKEKLKSHVVELVRHKPRNKDWYFSACETIRLYTNLELKNGRKSKAYIHLLLYKYLPYTSYLLNI